MPQEINSKEIAEKFLNDHDTFLFDCDGVLWRSTDLLPYIKETLTLLKERGKRFVFVTNNGTKSRVEYAAKFKKLGIDVEVDQIFGSAYSTAYYLEVNDNFDKKNHKVFVIGMRGLEDELHQAGIQTVGGTDEYTMQHFNGETDEPILSKPDPSIKAVVCSLDQNVNYLKLAYAQACLGNPEVQFLVSNPDSTFPGNGCILPDAGAVTDFLACCTGRKPDAILGKPSKDMMNAVKTKFDFDPSRAVMVGDRLNTDMQFGANCGLDTLFVLSGIDNLEAIPDSGLNPKYYAEYVGKLYELLK